MIKAGSFGDWNHRGTVFDHFGKKGVCRIYVSHGTAVNSIQIAYAEEKTIVLSEKLGGTGTCFDSVILDYPTEVLKGIQGSLDGSGTIRTISFVTNVRTYGPFGKEPETLLTRSKYNINFAPDEFFGVHGRADSNYIRAIGVYIKPSVSTSSAPARIKSEPSF